MSVIKRIEEQVQLLKKMQAAGAHQAGIASLITTLQLAQSRIESLEKTVDERLPSEAEIALQLLPAIMHTDPHLDYERQSREAFQLAETFLVIKDQRK